MKNHLNAIFSMFGAGVFILAATPSARAVPTLELISGGQTITISAGSMQDMSANPDEVTYLGSVGNFTINITTGEVGGSTAYPTLDISSLDATNLGSNGGTLTILFSDVGFGPSDGTATASLSGALASGASLSYSTYADSSNALLGTGASASLLTSQVFTANPVSGTETANLVESGPYSLTQEIVLSEGGGEVTQFDADLVTADPPPASSPLFTPVPVADGGSTVAFLGLVFVGVEALRRKLRPAI